MLARLAPPALVLAVLAAAAPARAAILELSIDALIDASAIGGRAAEPFGYTVRADLDRASYDGNVLGNELSFLGGVATNAREGALSEDPLSLSASDEERREGDFCPARPCGPLGGFALRRLNLRVATGGGLSSTSLTGSLTLLDYAPDAPGDDALYAREVTLDGPFTLLGLRTVRDDVPELGFAAPLADAGPSSVPLPAPVALLAGALALLGLPRRAAGGVLRDNRAA
ncbi:MAG: hypothetical protein ACFBWO_09035 [Paracoccaceae bacterium]